MPTNRQRRMLLSLWEQGAVSDDPLEFAATLWATCHNLPTLDTTAPENPEDWHRLEAAECVLRAMLAIPGFGRKEWLSAARRLFSRTLRAVADSDGCPAAALLPTLQAFVATYIRTAAACPELLPAADQPLIAGLLEAYARLIPRPVKSKDERFHLLSEMARSGADVFNLPRASTKRIGLAISDQAASDASAKATSAAMQSDWSQLAVLRSNWSVQSPQLVFAHHRSHPEIQFQVPGGELSRGPWELFVRGGDVDIELADAWSGVCWNCDDDGDYCEVQIQGPRGVRIERYVYLSRKENFAIAADCVRGMPAGGFEFVSRWPIDARWTPTNDVTTRAIALRCGSSSVRVFPLAVPCWRVESTPHGVECRDGAFEARYRAAGRSFFAPVVFDWDAKRRSMEPIWRKLTVSENQAIASPDAAAGYRLQMKKSLHLLLYRSLKRTEHGRAVLGYHTHRETAICKFNEDGDVSPLLLVEE